jgi:hypothetical protein
MVASIHAEIWDTSANTAAVVIEVRVQPISVAGNNTSRREVWQSHSFFYYSP